MQSLKLNGVNHFNPVNVASLVCTISQNISTPTRRIQLLTAGCFVDVFNEFHKELLRCTVYVMFLSMLSDALSNI